MLGELVILKHEEEESGHSALSNALIKWQNP